eukprot:CAMPEP_0201477604 /NCGR_PEP_ID=MMETSP0151_2-20130828/2601_1 /ASSEMBLY_ACC=CAM_ASM_000257 /TAXON_ID=200890 /ORGANISM="Paramoeba atlantica, Strain 621/1 / CCAP 1560/9" /LENGTH=215 /DNA_ID=CAMNT_0047858385 /DNA_START=112 /DNA_END=759 /DNA_ORIENTATION=+
MDNESDEKSHDFSMEVSLRSPGGPKMKYSDFNFLTDTGADRLSRALSGLSGRTMVRKAEEEEEKKKKGKSGGAFSCFKSQSTSPDPTSSLPKSPSYPGHTVRGRTLSEPEIAFVNYKPSLNDGLYENPFGAQGARKSRRSSSVQGLSLSSQLLSDATSDVNTERKDRKEKNKKEEGGKKEGEKKEEGKKEEGKKEEEKEEEGKEEEGEEKSDDEK